MASLLRFSLRRFAWSVPVVLLASFLLFWAVRATFDPVAKLRQGRDAGAVQREIERLGLDRSVPEQYLLWMKGFLTGDWGTSTRTGGSVSSLIGQALWPTVQLMFWGVLLAAFVALAIGVYTAVRQYSAGDYVLSTLAYVGISLPAFWFGLMLIQVLAVWPVQSLGWSEPPFYFVGLHTPGQSGFNLDYLRHLALPLATLTVTLTASWSRFARTAMLDTLSSDYVRTARAKGVPPFAVVTRHALRNALAPFVTIVALDTGVLFGGLIVTEQIYSIPGMGRLFLQSLQAGDVFVLVPWMFVVALAVVFFNLVADVSYALLDPKVKLR